MRFVKGALADSDSLASVAQLLHELCFDEIELDRPSLGYEPRCSAKCATCAALWVASKTGEVMRIDLRVRASADPAQPSRPRQRRIDGDRTARAIFHVHDGAALGGGCHLLVGRDSGVLDIYSDPPADDTDAADRRPALRVARLPLHPWSEINRGAWRALGESFEGNSKVRAEQHGYARGITAISTFRKADTLYIVVATRHPRLYVIEARGGRVRLLKPQLMPGWIEWIVHPEYEDQEASLEDGAPEPDRRIACISRAGHIVRLSHADLLSGGPGWLSQLALIPTAAMPFVSGTLLLGTTTGLFVTRAIRSSDRATAIPVTRSPVLCLDRATLARDDAAGKLDYVTMGLEDGRLQVIDAQLLREFAGVDSVKRAARTSEPWPPRYHNVAKQLGSAVLVVETLQPDGAGTDTAYVLAATRDHAVRLFHATTLQAQHERFAQLWNTHVNALVHATAARTSKRMFGIELDAAGKAAPDGCDERAWCNAILAVVLPKLAVGSARQRNIPEARSKLIQLAIELAARADRRALHQLSSQMDKLCEYQIEPLLQLSRAVLRAVPLVDNPEWKRFIASHLRDLNALADPARMRERELMRLVAWTRFVRKYVLLGHTFASKQTELRELVERNYATQKHLDALIYQVRLCQQQHDVRWSIAVDEHASENVAALHTAACDGHGTVAVVVTADGKLAVFDDGGRRLRIRTASEDAHAADHRRLREGDVCKPFGARGKVRVLTSTVARAGAAFRVVMSCQLTPTVGVAPGGASGSPPSRGKRVPALAVIDLAWSQPASDHDLIADVAHVPCGDEVHAVQPLPERADAFVAGLESHAAPIGWLHRGAKGWSLDPIADPEPSDARGPVIPIARSSLAPGKTPTRALAVAIDETTLGYLIVAGSDDGLVRVISLAQPDGEAPDWRLHRWERMNDAITIVVLGPHHLFDATAVHDEASESSRRILFSCYLGTASGDIFALSIERSAGATTGMAGDGLEFGPHHAQPLWGEALDGPIAAAQIWRTPLYRTDQPHREGDQSAEVLVVATEKGRLCLYNHAPSVANGRVAFEVSTTFNYRFRGMRLSRVALAGRVRALSMIEGTCDFVAAGPGGRLTRARLAYLRDSVERETLDQQELASRADPFAEPEGPLPTTMVARLDHLFLRSGHDAAFHTDAAQPRRDELKLDLCDLIRLERGAMSSYVMYRRLVLHEPWRALGDDAPVPDLESRVRGRLGQLDPENPEHAVLFKVVVKSLCRKYLHRDPRSFRADVVSPSKNATRWHDEVAVICEVIADYITRKLAYSTTAAARLRIVAIKELLRVPVLRHIAVADRHGVRIRDALDSALDSCLRDDDRLVRLEALRALWVMLRNVGVMVGNREDSDAVILALFPDGLGSVKWLLDRIVGGLLLVPSFRQRSALIGFAWHHVSVLLPLFRIFSHRVLALCNELIARGLSLDVVALCVWSLQGREATAIRSCINDYCLVTVLDKRNAREPYILRYKRKAGPQPRRNGSEPAAGPRHLRPWYAIDDAELIDEMAQLLDLLAQMWDVRDGRQLAELTPVTVAADSPYEAIAKVTADLIEIAGDLAGQTDRVRPLDRLARLGDRHRSPVEGRPALTAPIRAIIVEIVEVWQAICNPRTPVPGIVLAADGVDYKLGEPVTEVWGTFRLEEPPDMRESHVAITFYKWSTPSAVPRFRAAALATQALRNEASPEDRNHIVEITKVLDKPPPHTAYVVPLYASTLEASLRTLEDNAREQWTERAAAHIGRALRAAHTRSGSGARYHGDVKTSNILVELANDVERPVFRLGGFAPDPEPVGAARPVSIVPECLAQKYHGNDELGQRQWDDVAALGMILFQLLTGRTLQLTSVKDLSKPVKHLEELLAPPKNEHRRVLPKIIEALKLVFSGGPIPTLTIVDFLALIEPPATPEDVVVVDRDADPRRERDTASISLQGTEPVKHFDVFLCYSSHDQAEVKAIGTELKSRGYRPWLDEWELPPGKPWQPELESQIESIRSAAVFIGGDGTGPWQSIELRALLNQFVQRGCPVIPVILPSVTLAAPKLPTFLQDFTWVDYRLDDPPPLDHLIWGITSKKPLPPGSKL